MAQAIEAADGERGTMNDRRTTVANGNAVELWGHGPERDSAARSVAAALPRDMDGLRKVESDITRPVCVWIDGPEGDEGADLRSFEAPDGWQIAKVSVFSDGDAAYSLEREEGSQ